MTVEAAPATPSLRDTLESNYAAVESAAVDTVTAAPAASTPVSPDASAQTVAAPAPADTRARDEAGRFTEQPKDQKAAPKAPERQAPSTAATPAPSVAAPVARKRPSSWKPELDPHWEKLPKEVQDEIERREGDFIKGVSTYKTEYDNVKPIAEALKPYASMFQQNNIKPEQFVTALAATHQTLTSGNEEDQLKAFAKFATDYKIPLHKLLIQGDDGKVYLNQTYFQPQQPAQQQPLTREEVERIWAQNNAKSQLHQHIQQFREAKDASGHPLYPHQQEVWSTMDGLLRSGLAKDLPEAYAAALALPKHSALLAASHEQQRATEAAEKARQAAEVTARAKANAVSPRNQTPTELVTDRKATQQGLRSQLEANFDAQVAGGGRV